MACKYQYVMTRRAQQDIRQTVGYIRNDLGNETAAKALMKELNQYIERLCAFPESGRVVFAEYLPGVRIRRKVIGNYVLFYQILKEDNGSANLDRTLLANGENLIKLHFGVGLNVQLFDVDDVALLHAVLLTAGNNDCVHFVHSFSLYSLVVKAGPYSGPFQAPTPRG